ncbi:hypothetical protein [Gemmatimonas sp.]|uniref:hypothetical protein n=1 Tax=Gemmatimonas sp. TaxID=1962908 RepID=UPI00286A2A3D|nr:hypothetical protein [Gemmatimonas sp.]
MRTTIDLDDVLLQRLRDTAHREGVPFKALLHRVILRGLELPRPESHVPYRTPSFSMGQVREGIDLVKARWIADDLENEEIIRKMAEGR